MWALHPHTRGHTHHTYTHLIIFFFWRRRVWWLPVTWRYVQTALLCYMVCVYMLFVLWNLKRRLEEQSCYPLFDLYVMHPSFVMVTMFMHDKSSFWLGAVSNTQQCIDTVRQKNGSIRVFTFGVGGSFSEELVKGIANAGLLFVAGLSVCVVCVVCVVCCQYMIMVFRKWNFWRNFKS